MYFTLFVGVQCLSLFCYALLCIHSSFTIILKGKKKLVALLLLSYRCIVTCTVNVLWLFLTVTWFGLQYVIVVFPDHTYLRVVVFVTYPVRMLYSCVLCATTFETNSEMFTTS